MTVDHQQQSEIHILTIHGRLDASTVELLRREWTEADRLHLVVDLHDTPFIDSMGLAALVAGLKAARGRGGSFTLVSPSDAVRNILTLTAMLRVFTVRDSITDAVALTPTLVN